MPSYGLKASRNGRFASGLLTATLQFLPPGARPSAILNHRILVGDEGGGGRGLPAG